MTINLAGELRFDTRGLPEGYDPHKLYEYRRETLIKDATGIESFLYKYVPWSLVKSFAFAIDPTSSFKVAPGTITPINRKKIRANASVLQKRTITRRYSFHGWSQAVNYRNVSICWSPELNYDDWVYTPAPQSTNDQEVLRDTLSDTTSRTRLFGSTQGELELFKSFIYSPPRHVRNPVLSDKIMSYGPVEPSCTLAGGSQQLRRGDYQVDTYEIGPTGSRLSSGNLESLRLQEINYAKALCQKHVISMLKDYSPKKREYSYFRNLAELRDLPRSISSLRTTLLDLRNVWYSLASNPSLRSRIFDLKNLAKDIPNEYLSYHFGWKQTYNDLMDLLALPEKLAKKNQFLVSRSGKPTTFRVKRNFPSAQTASQSFEYETTPIEYESRLDSRIERESELRLVINATFDFPDINVPRLRYQNLIERTGVNPRVTDIYNLIPWTWLVDYFTGFGNYVELIDNINQDQNLINWGLISCRTHGKLITDFRSLSFDITRITTDPPNVTVETVKRVTNSHTSVLEFECQTRIDVAHVLDVKQTSVPSSLTAYQKSIIGALLAQRTEFSRAGTFRVRS